MLTLMEMDCIPAGMELFPAADEDQFEFIKRVIDDCDYYLLIVGGRYGSTTQEGISYTEKEYDYAIQKGLKVIALVHESPDEIPVGKSDIDPVLRERLAAFRAKVSADRLVKFWSKAEDLPGLVSLSLTKTIKMSPAIGWVRANAVANEELLTELNEIRKENSLLRARIAEVELEPTKKIEGLAGLDEKIVVHGHGWTERGSMTWVSTVSWREIFAFVSPYLAKYPNDAYVKTILLKALKEKEEPHGRHHEISDQDFQTIQIQLKALGLVNTKYSQTTKGEMALFWSLTPYGEALMMQLRTVPSRNQTQ